MADDRQDRNPPPEQPEDGAPAESPAGKPSVPETREPEAEPRTKRRWLRRAIKVLGGLLLAFVLLLAFLPQIINVLPAERWISTAASGFVPGTIKLEGLYLSYFGGIRLERLELIDPEAPEDFPELIALLEDFSIENGILEITTNGFQPGLISIGNLEAPITRYPSGRMDFEALIPPTDPDAPPPPAEKSAEPFVLDLEKLIPSFPVPIERFEFRLDRADLSFTDYATTKTLAWGAQIDPLVLRWPGGGEPFAIEADGALSGPQGSETFAFRTTLSDWIDGGQTTIGQADLEMLFDLGQRRAVQLMADLNGAEADLGATLQLPVLMELAVLAPEPVDLPRVQGAVSFAASLAPAERGGHLQAQAAIETQAVAVSELGDANLVLPLPDTTITAEAVLHQQSFARQEVELAITSPLLNLDVSEVPAPDAANQRILEASLQIRPEVYVAFARDNNLVDQPLPDVEGPFSLLANARYTEEFTPLAAALVAEWKAQRAQIPPVYQALFPEVLRLRDGELDLRPLAFTLTASAVPQEGGKLEADLALENGLLGFSADALYVSPERADAATTLSLPLGELMAWVNDEFLMTPATSLEGEMTLALEAAFDQPRLQHAGSLAIDGLAVQTAAVPALDYQDSLALVWDGTVEIGPELFTTISTNFTSNYAMLDASARYRQPLVEAAAVELAVDIPALMNGPASPWVPELPVSIEGNLRTTLEVSQPSATQYTAALELAAGEGFLLASDEFGFAIDQFSVAAEAETELLADGVAAVINSFAIGMQDFLTVEAQGEFAMRGEQVTWSLGTGTQIFYGPILEQAAPYLEENMGMMLAVAGESAVSIETNGEVLLTTPTLTYPRPIQVVADFQTVIEVAEWMMGEQMAVLEGLEDQRSWSVEINPLDFDNFQISETAETLLMATAYNDMAVAEDFQLMTEFNATSLRNISYAVEAMQLGAVQWSMEGNAGILEGLALELSLGANVPDGQFTLDMPSFSYEAIEMEAAGYAFLLPPLESSLVSRFDLPTTHAVVESFDLRTGDLLALSMSADVPWGKRQASTEGTISIPQAASVLEAVPPELIDPLVSALDGSIATTWDVFLELPPPGSRAVWPEQLAATIRTTYEVLVFQMPDIITMTGADGFLEAGLNNTSGYLQTENKAAFTLQNLEDPLKLPELRLTGFAQLEPNGDLVVDAVRLYADELETSATLRADVVNAVGLVQQFADATTGTEPMALVLGTPMEFFLQAGTKLPAIAAAGLVDEGSGSLGILTRLTNLPGNKLELFLEPAARNAGLEYGGLFRMTGMNGSFPLRLPFNYREADVLESNLGSGALLIELLRFFVPPYDLLVGTNRLGFTAGQGRWDYRFLSANFLGGTLDWDGALFLEAGSPVLAGDLAITGLDAATFLPNIQRVAAQNRSLTAFGSFSWRLPPDPTLEGMFEELSVNMSISEIGREVLRGLLTRFSETGFNPGVQSALAALRVSRPNGGLFLIQNGLMTLNINMLSAAGVPYDIPLFQRNNVANLWGAYAAPDMDDALEMTRTAILVLLSNSLAPTGLQIPLGERQ